jgi:hypothetical protein
MLAAGAVAALAIAGGGAAIAATSGDRIAESDAIVTDAAEQLGVTPARLEDALSEALKNRVDAAVEAGRLTEAQGQELKERIDAGEVPLVGPGPGHGRHHGPGPGLDAAASYLGLTEAELRTALEDGDTLAEVAQEQGKSVEGLVDAMVVEAQERLDQAVEDGRLTEAEAEARLAEIEEHVTALVNGERPQRPSGGPPPMAGAGGSSFSPPPGESA